MSIGRCPVSHVQLIVASTLFEHIEFGPQDITLQGTNWRTEKKLQISKFFKLYLYQAGCMKQLKL